MTWRWRNSAEGAGNEGADCEKVLMNTTSGNAGINQSGMGAYHGIEGFRTMNYAKGVFVQGYWNMPRLVGAPFGRFANFALRITLGASGK
jgi:coniferyl-aldehyde dehydrogenase